MRKVILQAALPLFLLAASVSMPVSAAGPAAPAMMKDGILVTPKGLTLYTFDKDVRNSGKSACIGDCIKSWPPLLAEASDRPRGRYTIITRDDGRRQWAYRGKPLYTWPEDEQPGDKYGDNKVNVWHVVK